MDKKIEKLYKDSVRLNSILKIEDFQDYIILLLTLNYFEAIYDAEVFSTLSNTDDYEKVIVEGLETIQNHWGSQILCNTSLEFENDNVKEFIKGLYIIIDTTNLKTRQEFIETFDYLLAKFSARNRKSGTYVITPPEIGTLFSKILKPQKKDSIYDPTCGTGTLLIQVAKSAKNSHIYGQEAHQKTFDLCQIMLHIHGFDSLDIKLGDTLTNPLHKKGSSLQTFPIVLSCPPYSYRGWDNSLDPQKDIFHRFSYGIPPKMKGDYAFVLHMLASLEEHGRMAVLLPHGVLFREREEKEIRKNIILENLLEAAIGLPSNLLYETAIPTVLLIFKKNRINQNILFIDASDEYQKDTKQNILKEENINRIVTAYEEFQTIPKFAYLASQEEIMENDFNLNIPYYVDSLEEEEEAISIEEMQKQYADIDKKRLSISNQILEVLKSLE